jgi:hypothetical protein
MSDLPDRDEAYRDTVRTAIERLTRVFDSWKAGRLKPRDEMDPAPLISLYLNLGHNAATAVALAEAMLDTVFGVSDDEGVTET